MRGPKRRRREETSTTGRAKQARSTQPTRSNGGGRNAPKRAAQRPPAQPPAVERPGDPPEGAGRGGPGDPPQGRARGALRRARNPTRQHTREAAARAAAAAALAGAPLATAKRACYRAGGVAGSLWARAARASQDPKATAGMGPRRLPRAPGATHGPHTDEARTTAAILLRRHAGKAGRERAPAIARRGPPSGPPQVHTRSGFARRGEAPSLS